jgi:hypothetical protein
MRYLNDIKNDNEMIQELEDLIYFGEFETENKLVKIILELTRVVKNQQQEIEDLKKAK